MLFSRKKILTTHAGGFHSDDIFACATLELLLDARGESYTVMRSLDEKIFETSDYVFDIGGVYDPQKNRFDHHQREGAGKRENGIPYATFGLVWKEYGEVVCQNKEVALTIDRQIVQPIDANDNGLDVFTTVIDGVSPVTFQDIVGFYTPGEDATENDYYTAFLTLVSLAKTILSKAITKAQKQSEVNAHLKELYEHAEEKRILVTDRKYGRFALTMAALYLPEVLYVIYPSKRGGFDVVATRVGIGGMESKKPFPEAWAGARETELQTITGVKTARFCHNARFLCGAGTKEDAMLLAELAIKG